MTYHFIFIFANIKCEIDNNLKNDSIILYENLDFLKSRQRMLSQTLEILYSEIVLLHDRKTFRVRPDAI